MDTRFEFRVLGPLEVTADGVTLALGGPQQRAVLALLLLSPNQVVSRERMIDSLWGESPPATAANALQVAVHGLRKVLGRERVVTQGAGYRLDVRPGELDLDRFQELVESARNEPAARAAPKLHAAAALRRGVALADLAGAAFVRNERERLEELQLAALERRVDADLEVGRASELVAELEGLVAEHPFRERFRGQLILALYRSGRQADALRAYREARETLVEELGVEPSRELQELESRILRQDPALDAAEVAERPRTNLPVPGRPLIGRELELAAVASLVRCESRLVTLTGPGGTGKTRLALEAGLELLPDFPGGVILVDLAPIRDHELVASTLARALGVTDTESELVDRLATAVGDRDTLLVVDNFEHLLAAAPFVADVVSRIPTLRLLATSREPLRVAPEHEYRVPPLELPARGAPLESVSRSDAVVLFVSRARSAEPSFELSAANAEAVAEICRALDGLPLALELAAARVRLLSPAALLERLENRLGVLDDGDRDLPDRQRTLRAAIDWSHELLQPPERALLARLSVFAGGWTLDAAEEISDAELSSLGSLVEKSLVQSGRDAAGEPRFAMLETVREYALEQLRVSGEEPAFRDRHAEYFAALAERVEPELYTSAVFDRVELEHDNFRAALRHAASAENDEVLLRLTAIARFWYVRGYQREGRGWLELALSRSTQPSRRRAVALGWAGGLAWTLGDNDDAIRLAHESLDLSRDVGEELGMLRALTALGLVYWSLGDANAARRFHSESLELARELERDRDVSVALANLSDVASRLGEYEEVRRLATESLAIGRRLEDNQIVGSSLLTLAASAIGQGRAAEARPLIVESLRLIHDLGFPEYLTGAMVALARAEERSDPALSARLVGAARTIRAPLGQPAWLWEPEWAERAVEVARGLLGEDVARAELEAGERDPEAVVIEVLASDPAS